MNESNASKPKLRWYQFSLRTLLLFVMVAGVVFGWLGKRIPGIRNEIRATDELRKVEASIGFYSQKDRNELPIPDRWLWKCFGDGPVRSVGMLWTRATDTTLENLTGLSNLKELDLYTTEVTDAGLEHLKGLTSLQTLSLFRTQVTDAGVKKLQKALPKCWIRHNSFRNVGPGKDRLHLRTTSADTLYENADSQT